MYRSCTCSKLCGERARKNLGACTSWQNTKPIVSSLTPSSSKEKVENAYLTCEPVPFPHSLDQGTSLRQHSTTNSIRTRSGTQHPSPRPSSSSSSTRSTEPDTCTKPPPKRHQTPPRPPRHRQNSPPSKPRRSPNTKHQPNRQQQLCNSIRRGNLNHKPNPILAATPPLASPATQTPILRVRARNLAIINPALTTHVLPKLLHARLHHSTFGNPRRKPVEVVESGREAEERDDGGDFVQEEERGDVRDRRGAERESVAAEESWEA
jgi:hypothetical protein